MPRPPKTSRDCFLCCKGCPDRYPACSAHCERYAAMGGSVPGWFSEALQATSYVLAVDKMEGYGCIAALYEAASKVKAVKRMAALTKLLAISTPISFMAGLANTTIV